ncbi:spore germination protein [Pseudalkalibacillus hwajinpoensis]|uniref:spore germination protein n=1 Tax=Guptibacillus hwajinpoensis TaxID=208199 RepID=UPI00325BD90D
MNLTRFFKRKKTYKTIKNSGLDSSQKISTSIQENVSYIKDIINHSDDLKQKELKNKMVLLYFFTLADQEKVTKKIIYPLSKTEDILTRIQSNGDPAEDLHLAIQALLKGYAVILIEGQRKCYLFHVVKTFNRSIDEPDNEKVVRGSHDGFVEDLFVNVNLIRKRIETIDLTVRFIRVGKRTNTNVGIVYMTSLADPKVVQKVEERIKSIDSDNVFSPGYMEEFIEDTPSSPFPQMLATERPDRVIANLLEGRVAVIVEGSPTTLILPITFFAFYQTPDDYNGRWLAGSYLRLIRLMSFVIAIALPGFYIGVIGFHFEVIPDDLVLPIKASIVDIAFPPIVEALAMVITIELIREAGIRLPSPVGQTIGIVGGLIIGDAVVRAGLISNVMIVIIAVTAIASFVVPSNEMSTTVRILTYPILISASLFGFIGIVFTLMIILIHLCKLESFGSPYFAPLAPLRWKEIKDAMIRVPVWKMNERPSDTQVEEIQRQGKTRGWKKDGKNRR